MSTLVRVVVVLIVLLTFGIERKLFAQHQPGHGSAHCRIGWSRHTGAIAGSGSFCS